MSSSILLAISVNFLINIDNNTFVNENNELINNSTYYNVIKVTFSEQCSLGQYYDQQTYFFSVLYLYFQNPRYVCLECQVDEFIINQNMTCETCVSGGHCLNGILYNQAGKFF